jgi:hypothetical protein
MPAGGVMTIGVMAGVAVDVASSGPNGGSAQPAAIITKAARTNKE